MRNLPEVQIIELENNLRAVIYQNERLRQDQSYPILADTIATRFPNLAGSTILSYYREFINNQCQGFDEDMQGKHHRESLVSALHLEQPLKAYMRTLKNLLMQGYIS